jgi:Alkylmercury lyase
VKVAYNTLEPQEAVVLSGSACREGPSFRGCCEVLNFFETRENAERYLAENASLSGHPISRREAIEAGRIVFGEVFTEMD